MARHIYGMHDWDPAWGSIVAQAGKTGWCVITEELGANPDVHSGANYAGPVGSGITPIVRLNYSHHGIGTIPKQAQYADFAKRCASFAQQSAGCSRWIIGNEPNIVVERPDPKNNPITPYQYGLCYELCRNAIKQVQPSAEVIVAGIAPYNEESGWYLHYFESLLYQLDQRTIIPDALCIHTYSRGGNPQSIISEDKMDAPYQAFYNGFRAYRDVLGKVPPTMHHLPVYITETDQNSPWVDSNSGWVRAAYAEIDHWNQAKDTQKIQALCLYRWSADDQWQISNRQGVVEDFRQTLLSTDYKALNSMNTVQVGPMLNVTAPAGANLRLGPGTNYPIHKAIVNGSLMVPTGRTTDNSWWRVKYEGKDLWVSSIVVSASPASFQVPVVPVTVPAEPLPAPTGDKWERTMEFVLAEEGGYQRIENDKGNWTGGQVGVGELKGTNMGITAASYPNLDIRNLTKAAVMPLYFKDYWVPSGASQLPWPVCVMVMDTAVLHGTGTAQRWLAEVGPNPLIFAARRLEIYPQQDNWDFWGKAWVNRVVRLLKVCGKGYS